MDTDSGTDWILALRRSREFFDLVLLAWLWLLERRLTALEEEKE